jgi:hypothetical protein
MMKKFRSQPRSVTSHYGWFTRRFGMSPHTMSEYGIWANVLTRCLNKNCEAYPRYGGRGITVCDRWTPQGPRYSRTGRRVAFMNFMEDMGERPSTRHTIERRNNNLGYSKQNCYWATYTEQANNRRTNRLLTYRGQTMTVAQWCKELKFSQSTVYTRLADGWSVSDALSTPTKRRLSSKQIRQIIRRVFAGETQTSVAASFDISKRTVFLYAHAAGFSRWSRS